MSCRFALSACLSDFAQRELLLFALKDSALTRVGKSVFTYARLRFTLVPQWSVACSLINVAEVSLPVFLRPTRSEKRGVSFGKQYDTYHSRSTVFKYSTAARTY